MVSERQRCLWPVRPAGAAYLRNHSRPNAVVSCSIEDGKRPEIADLRFVLYRGPLGRDDALDTSTTVVISVSRSPNDSMSGGDALSPRATASINSMRMSRLRSSRTRTASRRSRRRACRRRAPECGRGGRIHRSGQMVTTSACPCTSANRPAASTSTLQNARVAVLRCAGHSGIGIVQANDARDPQDGSRTVHLDVSARGQRLSVGEDAVGIFADGTVGGRHEYDAVACVGWCRMTPPSCRTLRRRCA